MRNRINDIQVIPIKPKDGLVGFASFVLDDSFYVGSIGIYTRPQGGYRLTYPNRQIADKSFSIFHPLNKEISDEITDIIVAKFESLQN